jgi:TPR repeat protein
MIMSNDLELLAASELSNEENVTLEKNIDNIISSLKNNRQEVNKLVFESVSAMTTADEYENELSNKSGLSRLIGSITGSNKALQDKINSNRAASQYAMQLILKELAERNLMTLDLVTVLNTKMNAMVKKNGEEINKIYYWLTALFKKNRSDLCKLAVRVDALERNVNLLNWENSIEYQEYAGVEYPDLEDVTKIVCMVRDFYDITKGKWSTSDLLLLKKAMSVLGLNPRSEVNYFGTLKTIANNESLRDKFLGEKALSSINDPTFLISAATLQKLNFYSNEEHYIVESVADILSANQIQIKDEDIIDTLTIKYLEQTAHVNALTNVEIFDFMVDLLFNLQQLKSMIKYDTVPNDFKDENEKFKWLQKAAEQGNVNAQNSLGVCYDNGEGAEQDHKKAFEWYKKAAEQGLADAQNSLGACYDNGVGVKQDYEKAFEWYKKAAEQGLAVAEFNVGKCYFIGKSVKKNYETAVEFLQKAAEQGHADAQNSLGLCYDKGEGIEQDHKKAFEWYKKAAEQGNASAQKNLRDCYKFGIGVEKDLEKADYWYKKSTSTHAAKTHESKDKYKSTSVVAAPMPGKISEIRCKIGDMAKSGDVLLMFEAMKMQNEIMSPCDGFIKEICVKEGNQINTGEAMIIMGCE